MEPAGGAQIGIGGGLRFQMYQAAGAARQDRMRTAQCTQATEEFYQIRVLGFAFARSVRRFDVVTASANPD
jgi:hypothetical protein